MMRTMIGIAAAAVAVSTLAAECKDGACPLPGGRFATVKIALPKAWYALMAKRGYKPLADFRLATDLKPDTPQATRQNRSRPTARGEGRGGSGAGGASRRRDVQGSERGRRGPPSDGQQRPRFRRFRGNAPQDAPRQ